MTQPALLDIGPAVVPVAMLWHYTPACSARAILRSGSIEPRTQGPDLPPLVWFSANQFIERTAAGLPEGSLRRRSYARFGVDRRQARSFGLRRFETSMGASLDSMALAWIGTLLDADASQWWCTRRQIAVTSCAVQIWDGRMWVANG